MEKENFRPRCMATALTTVPHRDPEAACRAMLRYFPEAPSIPRLSMVVRMYLDGMPCLVIDPAKKQLRYDPSRKEELMRFYEQVLSGGLDSFAMSPKYAAVFYLMLEALKNSCPPGRSRYSNIHRASAGRCGEIICRDAEWVEGKWIISKLSGILWTGRRSIKNMPFSFGGERLPTGN